MNKITFEKVKEDSQIEKMCNLANEIWHEHFTPIIGEKQVEYMVEKFQSIHAIKEQLSNGYEYYIFILDDKLIGYTGICCENNQLFLSKLYIHKTYRGKGFAREAINFLSNICIKNKLSKIWLTVNKHNYNTIKAYEKMKFVIVREQVTDIGNGFVMDDYIMEKNIYC